MPEAVSANPAIHLSTRGDLYPANVYFGQWEKRPMTNGQWELEELEAVSESEEIYITIQVKPTFAFADQQ